LRKSGGGDAAGSGAVAGAIEQHLTLFDGSLTAAAQRGLRAAFKRSIVKVDLAVPEI